MFDKVASTLQSGIFESSQLSSAGILLAKKQRTPNVGAKHCHDSGNGDGGPQLASVANAGRSTAVHVGVRMVRVLNMLCTSTMVSVLAVM